MTSESAIQSQIRREFAYIGPVWRNNSGAYQDEYGRQIRYGLANESKKENEEIKSSDLICITPVKCYVEGIGWTTLGVFTAIEVKDAGWTMKPSDKRAKAQAKYHQIVRDSGGYAGFATSVVDIWRIIGRHGY